MTMKALAAMLLTFAVAALLVSQSAPPQEVGPLRDGKFLLNSRAVLSPAGKQIPLDTLPMNSLLSPDGKHLLVLHGGYRPPSIHVLNAATLQLESKIGLPDAWLGMAFAPGGSLLYVGGGSRSVIYEYRFFTNEGKLELSRTFPVVPEKDRKATDFVGDVALSPDGRLIYIAMLYRDEIAVINPQSGMVIEHWRTGKRPYKILFHPDGKSYFVSAWAGAAVYQHEADTGRSIGMIGTGPHPTDMVWRDRQATAEADDNESYKARIFVTAGNTNNVNVLGISGERTVSNIETINVGLYPVMPAGMTPSALALSPDRNKLFVVCSDANAVAVVDVMTKKSRVEGFIPSGWYPIAARVMPDNRLLVFNGRGTRSYPNPQGPNPTKKAAPTHEGIRSDQYVGLLQTGTMSVVDVFSMEQLDQWTRTVRANSPYNPEQHQVAHRNPATPIPQNASETGGPIEHVIYIIKENRTYDQVLGDLGIGNGDPSLTLFGEKISPNHHKLAREFVLLDNFYVNADVSADGHNWSTAGIAPDYVQRMWPNSYAGRRKTYDYEGGEPAATPPGGYIWSSVRSKRLTMRNYGYMVNNIKDAPVSGKQVGSVRDPQLTASTNFDFRGFDLEYLDINRAKTFLADLQQMENSNTVPRFIILRLGNDHTSGTSPGKYTPQAQMADNDYALGQIVEGVSRSKMWAKTAIFVLEDDAQNGPDHVDSHRSPAYVISPYAKRAVVDHTMYNTVSMLRTMELILGLNPLTMHDAGAQPMANAFQLTPDLKPYTAEKPRIAIDARNPENAPKAAESRRMNFSEADEIDDDELNEVLWVAIRGTEPPVPVRSYFSR